MLAFGEACLEKRGVEKVTGEVAPEWPARAVRTLEPGRKSDDQQPSFLGTKRGDRAVEPVRMSSSVVSSVCDQSFAQAAVRFGFCKSVVRKHANSMVLSSRKSASALPYN